MSFLSFLLVSFLIFWVLRLVLPALLRWALTAFVRKQMRTGGIPFGAASNPFESNANPFAGQAPPRPERSSEASGRVRVDYVPPKAPRQRRKDFRGGDYVEFEEVK
ncbi:DUF4834 family protein [Hymenobacter gummosus]|uniref:DUF4834 family protein n=1 Tax=Hymenobacter gummosus TaxID=1776032 RepID=A0A3S0QL80_9BACT|nr:DUF4834 family protein [Hymenobacter gummosus]RTQ53577.1 DUF4834 family protein [Hymenobacter gummosus]